MDEGKRESRICEDNRKWGDGWIKDLKKKRRNNKGDRIRKWNWEGSKNGEENGKGKGDDSKYVRKRRKGSKKGRKDYRNG